jgi:hypothetical protein
MGKWSDISVNKRPLRAWLSRLLVKILSIRVAECEVILVGCVIKGKNILVYIISKNLLVNS